MGRIDPEEPNGLGRSKLDVDRPDSNRTSLTISPGIPVGILLLKPIRGADMNAR